MSIAVKSCGKCGAEFFSDASQEFCSACLLETALFTVEPQSSPAATGSFEKVKTIRARVAPAEKGTDFGDYELLEEMGRGGQGLVYRARQKSLNRTVALKIIGLGHLATKTHLKRFHLEAEAAASLDHPCIVPIYEIGERDGSCYFSMKFVEGGPLNDVVQREPMSPRRAAELIAKLARTVNYAHEHGVFHRDIKPGNILLDAKGEPHLTDFGLARLAETKSDVTRTIEVLGTPAYMAPEQACPQRYPARNASRSDAGAGNVAGGARGRNGQATSATDVYGLGAVFYHLLTGQPPFAGGTTYETIRLVLETEPRQPRVLNSEVDRDLATICLKCLEKDPKRRYPSALALAEDLEHWLKHEPIDARRVGPVGRAQKWVRRQPAIAALIASLVALGAVIGWNVWKSELVHRSPTTGIAVLPFENLSNDREDAFFADGVQDDLLTKLANIAALKVISRTSVMQYRGERNMRQIGEALRVSHVLEGSVRKTGAWLHINAQLIDTRTDSHVWAKQFDGDLKDLFAIQSEIARKVAEQLHVKVSAAEKLAIDRPPTADLTAFNLYSRAKSLLATTSFGNSTGKNSRQAIALLNEAVTHDPEFFQAYCLMAYAHDLLYFSGFEHTDSQLALGETAIQTAFRLRPDAGEAHLAQAQHLYWGYLDYDGALAELKVGRQTLPNDPRVFALRGYIERRQGKQEEALRSLERAIELAPRDLLTLHQIAISYGFLRRHADEAEVLDRVLAIEPSDVQTQVTRADVELEWKADTLPLHRLIETIRDANPSAVPSIADAWLICALAERDAPAAKNASIALGERGFNDYNVLFDRYFLEGLVARMTKDGDKARAAFNVARAEQEELVRAQPDDGGALVVLGLIDAALGHKGEALREGRRACELLSMKKDAMNGPILIKYLAIIAAWVGDKDLACEQLATAARGPSNVSYGQLKLLPWWDPLRGDPRFEKIVTSLAPKEN